MPGFGFTRKIDELMAKKTGLVLSGGGVKGVAHIGVIRALEENGISPDFIAGASAGALVGALYAAGYSPGEMMDVFRDVPIFRLSHYAWGKPGLLNTEKFEGVLRDFFPDDRFEALSKPLFITATDLNRGKTAVFHQGPLIRPLLASAAFPIVFSPVEIGDTLYADGGILNNFPVDLLTDRCDHIIGVYIHQLRTLSPEELDGSFEVLQRVYEILVRHDAHEKYDDCDLIIEPPGLDDFFIFDFSELEKICSIGYEAAMAQMQTLKKRLADAP